MINNNQYQIERPISSELKNKILAFLGIRDVGKLNFQLSTQALIDSAISNGEGELTSTGALMCATGKYTGRSPKDRFIVRDELSTERVDWGNVNLPFDEARFDRLHQKMCQFVENKQAYVRFCVAGADPRYQLKLSILTTSAWQNLFCANMFLRPSDQEVADFEPNFTVLAIPEIEADPGRDGTRGQNFAILNLSKRILLIGGTGYAGEIKKGIFSALNFLMPQQNVLPMHCSVNVGSFDDVAIFFGLSGTGKTTLSTDPSRRLIGDDEHGWSDQGIFNFEGGCYAKVIDLTRDREQQIFDAIRPGAIVENTRFIKNSNIVDYSDASITENTRTSYPINFIDNAVSPSLGTHPDNIFFLTCDAFGVLPPLAMLTLEQSMDYFLLGYTAKVAGTEMGISEPQATFSPCFGAAFMPLHPTEYARMLGKRISQHHAKVWLLNTGWTGGSYGTGHRMELSHTRAIIHAVLTNSINLSEFVSMPVFNLLIPTACPGVPDEILNPREAWADPQLYDQKAEHLNGLFAVRRESFSGPTVNL